MKMKEVHIKAGPFSKYVGYILVWFLWYLLQKAYAYLGPIIPESSIEHILQAGLIFVFTPALLVITLGGIHQQQCAQDTSGHGGSLKIIILHYWHMIGAYLLSIILLLPIALMAVIWGNSAQPESWVSKLLNYISIPLAAISLFWFAAIILERKVFLSLFRVIRILVACPLALAIGIVWGALNFLDTTLVDVDFLREQQMLVRIGISAGVLAFARVLASAYALAIYKKARVEIFNEPSEQRSLSMLKTPASSGETWAKASFTLTFFAFLPLVHLAALVAGIVALTRKKRFVMRAVTACCVGSFFTILYLLLITGWFVSRTAPTDAYEYAFLANANPELAPYVALLEQGSFLEAKQHIEQSMINDADPHWSYACASALAKVQSYDLDGALEDFHIAAEKQPEASEFYYYYGRALLEDEQEELAAEQFQRALTYNPQFKEAERYLTLSRTAYKPSTMVSAVWSVLILLSLFTLHEYGHTFAAWKLGDDTAKNRGRLTLNPIAHLDPIGSILLPALLLWRQSDIVFGWAKSVPVNRENFQDPRKDNMIVSFAGPAINLIISMICFVMLGCLMLLIRLLWPETLALNLVAPTAATSLVGPPRARWLVIFIMFLKQLFFTSLGLGVFNLIPVPPLDGSWILSGLLPPKLRNLFERVRPYSSVIFLLLVITPIFDYFMAIPIGLAWALLYICALAMGFA